MGWTGGVAIDGRGDAGDGVVVGGGVGGGDAGDGGVGGGGGADSGLMMVGASGSIVFNERWVFISLVDKRKNKKHLPQRLYFLDSSQDERKFLPLSMF